MEISGAAEARMSRRNINFSKEGMRVGVKDIGNESYVDKTQRWVVKAWELSGNAPEAEGSNGGGEHARKRYGPIRFLQDVASWRGKGFFVGSWSC